MEASPLLDMVTRSDGAHIHVQQAFGAIRLVVDVVHVARLLTLVVTVVELP